MSHLKQDEQSNRASSVIYFVSEVLNKQTQATPKKAEGGIQFLDQFLKDFYYAIWSS